MLESYLATSAFWLLFAFSPGPFWTSLMQYAMKQPLKKIYREYSLYYITGWLSLLLTLGSLVHLLGQISPEFIAWMYIVGVIVVLRMALKIAKTHNTAATKDFDFQWKAMSLLSWTNPKCWLLIPIGFLSAQYTDHFGVNILLYYLAGMPIFFGCVAFWAMLGKLGARISTRWLGLFNAFMMFLFAIYLAFEGWRELSLIYVF